jgi:hypothetical protein
MPLQNRAKPTGEIVVSAARGTMLGNRGGCFHKANQKLKRRPYASKQWICCILEFKNRRRRVMSPGLYTELFFLDEVTALSAGHRPCFECRRADAIRFAEIWAARSSNTVRTTAPDMDEILHPERIDTKHQKVTYRASIKALPDGTFINLDGQPHLKWRAKFWPWSLDGYGKSIIAPTSDTAEVLTPASIVAQFSAGYKPSIHQSLVI